MVLRKGIGTETGIGIGIGIGNRKQEIIQEIGNRKQGNREIGNRKQEIGKEQEQEK